MDQIDVIVEKRNARREKWDVRFLDLASVVSSWSKDPSTKVGAVIVDDKNRVVSLGFNGFARGVDDHEERYATRDIKYKMVVHAECNALLFASRSDGHTLYTWPMPCCSRCAVLVIQAGIKRVVSMRPSPDALSRWGEDFELAYTMFREAGVEVVVLDGPKQ